MLNRVRQAEHFPRRWIFRLNLILAALTIPAVLRFMPLRKVEGSKLQKLKAIDFTGAALILLSTTLVVVHSHRLQASASVSSLIAL
jgi:hypothetical protein